MPGSFMVGVSVLVEHQGHVLLLHRAATKDFGGGEWEPVSGRVEQGENAEQAAAREVQEETGLTVVDLEVFDSFAFVRGDGGPELIGITFRGMTSGREVTLSEEHDSFEWLPKSRLLTVPTNAGITACFRKYLARWME